jgi:hypothetical protein
MSEVKKCPKCPEMLNADSAISHLTVGHQMPLREAYRWAGLHLGVLGQSDGMGQSRVARTCITCGSRLGDGVCVKFGISVKTGNPGCMHYSYMQPSKS